MFAPHIMESRSEFQALRCCPVPRLLPTPRRFEPVRHWPVRSGGRHDNRDNGGAVDDRRRQGRHRRTSDAANIGVPPGAHHDAIRLWPNDRVSATRATRMFPGCGRSRYALRFVDFMCRTVAAAPLCRLEVAEWTTGRHTCADLPMPDGPVHSPHSAAPSGQAAMQTRLPARSARIQKAGAWESSMMRPPAANGCGHAMLGLFARDRDIDVHRMSQGFGGVKVLHPDRRSVPEWIDGVVLGQFGVAEHGTPEADIDRIRLGRDGELHLLHPCPVSHGAVLPRHRRHRVSQLHVPFLESLEAAGQPHGELTVGDRHRTVPTHGAGRRSMDGSRRPTARGPRAPRAELPEGRRSRAGARQQQPPPSGIGETNGRLSNPPATPVARPREASAGRSGRSNSPRRSCRRRRGWWSRRRSRAGPAGRRGPLPSRRRARRRPSGPARSRWRAGTSAPGRRTSRRRRRSPASGWVSSSTPCGGTVPQECWFGSISGASARVEPRIGSRSSRSSAASEWSGRAPVALTMTSASTLRPSAERCQALRGDLVDEESSVDGYRARLDQGAGPGCRSRRGPAARRRHRRRRRGPGSAPGAASASVVPVVGELGQRQQGAGGGVSGADDRHGLAGELVRAGGR